MRRTFVTNLALLLFLNLLVKPAWIFGVEVGVQNAVGEENFGFYFSLLNFSIILNILLDLGITSYNNRNIAQNHQLLSKHVSNIVVLKLLLAVLYFLVSLTVAVSIGYDWKQLSLLFWLIFNQFLASFILYLRSNISGLQFFKTDSVLSVLDKTILIVICSLLLWGNITGEKFRIEWLVYGQTVAYLIAVVTAFLIVVSKSEFIRLRFDRNFFIVFLRQSYPYALLILIMACYNRIDSVILERMLPDGKEQAGIYAQGFRFLEASTNFGFLFAGLLIPMFAKMIKQKESIEQLVQLSFLLIFIPSAVIAVSAGFYRQEIMDLFYPAHIQSSPVIFSILMTSFVFMGTGTYIFGSLLTANGSMRQLNIMAMIALGFNLIANISLIPYYGAIGCAVAGLITQVFTATAQIWLSVKTFRFRVNTKLIILTVMFVIGVWAMGMLAKEIISVWYIGFFAMIIVSVALAMAIKLLNVRMIFDLVRYKEEQV
ncbi:MAG: oligosaccharide flippase family protein [Bacteroidetes bacterium]|nr:oligosaccharide flippase family protein [Bacteroidota bacterium]